MRSLLLVSLPLGSCLRHARALWSLSSHVCTHAILAAFDTRNKLATFALLTYISTWELLGYLRRATAGTRPWFSSLAFLKTLACLYANQQRSPAARVFFPAKKTKQNKTSNLGANKRGFHFIWRLNFWNIFIRTACAMIILPREVLLEISKWLSLEERMTHLAPVCKYLYNVMHDLSVWRTVYSDAEFTISSFNCLFRHDEDLQHVGLSHS